MSFIALGGLLSIPMANKSNAALTSSEPYPDVRYIDNFSSNWS